MVKNPYNPSFGQKPERFLGRDVIVYEILSALENPNSPWRTTLLIGVRGSGKTALLSDLRESIQDSDTIVVFVTPENDILDDILSQVHENLPKTIAKNIPKPTKLIVGRSVEFSTNDDSPAFLSNFRYQLTSMLKVLQKKGLKLLLLVDESQKHSASMRTFIATYQHLIRERYDVNLVMAGLPNVISDILNDEVLTFLRRANQVILDNVDVSVVAYDYQEIFCNEYDLSENIANQAAIITRGYPYLIQLIGFYMWEFLKTRTMEKNVLDQVTVQARAMMFQNVHKLLYRELSQGDKDFAHAMAMDENSSRFADIITRTGKEKNYLSTYRLRLIDSGYIRAVGRGELAFSLPFTREFLLQEEALAEL